MFWVTNGIKSKQIYDIDEALAHVKDSYDYLHDEYNDLKEELASFNKDDEIQKLKDEIRYLRKHSLQQLSDKELTAELAFRNKHYEECARPLRSKIYGNTYIYELSGTGIGTCIKITCPICGKSEDITDTESW